MAYTMQTEDNCNEIECKLHPRYIWLRMVRPVLMLLFILFVLNFTYLNTYFQQIMLWPFSIDILLIDLLFAVIILVPSYIWISLDYMTFVYIIKKEELVIRKGVIRKRHNAIPYNKIRNVQRLQSILERLFGLCTISIETAGISLEFPDSVIPGILNSKELPEIILMKMHEKNDTEKDFGDSMRNIISQINKLDQRSPPPGIGRS